MSFSQKKYIQSKRAHFSQTTEDEERRAAAANASSAGGPRDRLSVPCVRWFSHPAARPCARCAPHQRHTRRTASRSGPRVGGGADM